MHRVVVPVTGCVLLLLSTIGCQRLEPIYLVSLDEDIRTGHVRLHFATTEQFSDGGYVVEGEVEIDTAGSSVWIRPKVSHPLELAPSVIAGATGTFIIKPPADSFALNIDNDQYLIAIAPEVIEVWPTRTFPEALITNSTAPRLALNSFGFVFDAKVLFEGYEHLGVAYADSSRIISMEARDSLLEAVSLIGGHFVVLPAFAIQEQPRWWSQRSDSVNLMWNSGRVRPQNERIARPVLYFEYAGDRQVVSELLPEWESQLGPIEVFWIRDKGSARVDTTVANEVYEETTTK